MKGEKLLVYRILYSEMNQQLEIKRVTRLYPGVTVDLVQRHRVTVVLGFCPPTHNDHGVFDQSSSVEETGQRLYSKDIIQKPSMSYMYAMVKMQKSKPKNKCNFLPFYPVREPGETR